jgi:hypothetical protein
MNIRHALCAALVYAVMGSSVTLLSTTAAAADFAQVPAGSLSPPSTVTDPSCRAVSRQLARALGDRFYQQRAFHLAAECYRVAGEYSLANRAFLRAAEPESESTARTLATNRDEIKTQVRQFREAFRAKR